MTTLYLNNSQLTNLELPVGLTNLTLLYLNGNELTNLTLHTEFASLVELELGHNQLTDLSFLAHLTSLTALYLYDNQLTNLTLPAGPGGLTYLNLYGNQLTTLSLPAGLTNLSVLILDSDPLQSFILPEPLANGALSSTVANLIGEGVAVSIYPLAVSLVASPWVVPGSFEFLLKGPPGNYHIEVTPDFSTWTDIGPTVNVTGSVTVTDPSANSRPHGFYGAVLSE